MINSREEYRKAIELIEDNGQEVRPEIYNNIGSLNIRRGDLEGAKKYLNMALEKVRSDIENQHGKCSALSSKKSWNHKLL